MRIVSKPSCMACRARYRRISPCAFCSNRMLVAVLWSSRRYCYYLNLLAQKLVPQIAVVFPFPSFGRNTNDAAPQTLLNTALAAEVGDCDLFQCAQGVRECPKSFLFVSPSIAIS